MKFIKFLILEIILLVFSFLIGTLYYVIQILLKEHVQAEDFPQLMVIIIWVVSSIIFYIFKPVKKAVHENEESKLE